MRRFSLKIVLILLALATLACNLSSGVTEPTPVVIVVTGTPPDIPSVIPPTLTSTSTVTLTFTPLPTNTLIPTNTATPTNTPTATDPPTATATITPGGPTSTPRPTNTAGPSTTVPTPNSTVNLLNNPEFEGDVRPVIFGEVNVYKGWQPFYCDEPYTSTKCDVPRPCSGGDTVGCNPAHLKMGRPEFKAATLNFPDRVHGGKTAQQWFCFLRTCTAGVYQTFDTAPGQNCEVGAYIQSWSNYDDDPASELTSQDDRDNSVWHVRVDLNGDKNAFATGLLTSQAYGYDEGIYDQYIKVSLTFTATGDRTTVFFEDARLWPIGNNDSYIDDAYAFCD